MRILIPLIILLLLNRPAYSEEEFTGFGIGSKVKTCGSFTKNYETNPDRHAVTMQWVSGFITGVNYSRLSFLGERSDRPGEESWLIKYCEENPLHNFMRAVVGLVKELEK